MKLLEVRWFNQVGIVRVEDPYEGIVYFIKEVEGHNEVADTRHVMEWGSRFPNDAGDVLFGIKRCE